MELERIKRLAYWVTFFVFILLLAVFMTAERLTVTYRVILIVLLAILSSMFRLENRFSFLSISLAIVAGIFTGVLLSNDHVQVWSFTFLYVMVFFVASELFERKLLGV